MSPEKHFSDGWIQNERMLTNISSGTFWNYWHNPFRSTGNGFSIKTMWNGFKYSWNKSRKKRNSQDRCDVLPGRGMSRTQPDWQLHKTLRRQSQPKPQHGWGADLQAYPSPRSYSSRWLLGWGVTLYWGYGGRGAPVDSPIATHVWATLRKLPGSSETKPMTLGEEYWGAQRNGRWKQWVDKFLFQRIKFSKTNSNEKLLADLTNFISPHPCWNTLKPAN